MVQPDLFDDPPPRFEGIDEGIVERFVAFHNANPHVYDKLVELALGLKARGCKRYGIAGLFEVLRWQRAMQTTGDKFKLNNNFRAPYARLIMRKVISLADFFETRESVADGTT